MVLRRPISNALVLSKLSHTRIILVTKLDTHSILSIKFWQLMSTAHTTHYALDGLKSLIRPAACCCMSLAKLMSHPGVNILTKKAFSGGQKSRIKAQKSEFFPTLFPNMAKTEWISGKIAYRYIYPCFTPRVRNENFPLGLENFSRIENLYFARNCKP